MFHLNISDAKENEKKGLLLLKVPVMALCVIGKAIG